MTIVDTVRIWAIRIKRDVMTLWFARSHPDTPWHAKALGACAVAYALSPIDLIPDVIPILGYVDDVILIPVLIWLTVRLLPQHVLLESRARAEEWIATSQSRPRSVTGAVVIVCIWLVGTAACGWWLVRAIER